MSAADDIAAARLRRPATSLANWDYLVMRPLIDWMRDVAVQYVQGAVLDYGCGNKPYQSFFEGRFTSYVGADVAQNTIGTVEIVLGASTTLPVADRSFSTVLSTQVFEHVPNPDVYLAEASRVLAAGGHLILTCPGAWMLHEEPHDYWRYTRYGLAHILQKHGFDAVRIDAGGGAWRLIGQTFLNHLAFGRKYSIPLVSKAAFWIWVVAVNVLFSFLDRINTNTKDTVNYMVIARKRD